MCLQGLTRCGTQQVLDTQECFQGAVSAEGGPPPSPHSQPWGVGGEEAPPLLWLMLASVDPSHDIPLGLGVASAPHLPLAALPSSLVPGEGEHSIRKMELPQAPCLNSCSAAMTNSSSQRLGARGGALSYFCSQSPGLPGDQLPRQSLAPCRRRGLQRPPRLSPPSRAPQPLSEQPPPSSWAASLRSRVGTPHPG